MIHTRTLHALEFDRILQRLAGFCLSDSGRERALNLQPLAEEQDVTEAQKLYDESRTFAARPGSGDLGLGNFPDVSAFLDLIGTRGAGNARYDTDAFWALRSVLATAMKVRDAICQPEGEEQWPRLRALATNPPLPENLHAALQRCLGDDGNLRDESSPELFQVRVELRSLHQTALRKVRSYAERYNILAYLQDEFMTLSSDRYVLPFKATYKNKLQGIIHDWSQTGETCYFEPMFLVELNNRIQELKREEREEERRVLLYLGNLLEGQLDGAQAAVRLLTELDLLQAKARMADACGARMVPVTPVSEGLLLAEARHPLLVLAEQDALAARGTAPHQVRAQSMNRIHPVDLVFRPGERAVIVTGGNAGGKTVCLKTLGLCVAMTLAGLPVPAKAGSHLPWFTRVDAFIGDEQSLEANVSTFTAQIEHLAKAWKHLDLSGLVLLDEFGSGTDPAQGAALAQAVLDELLAKQTFVLTATHFPALKGYALAKEGARAASMLFDLNTHKPLYILAYDQVGASQALDVAREHGLPESIVARARHYLLQDGEDTSALLAKLNDLAKERSEELRRLKEEEARARNAAARYRERLETDRRKLYEEVRARAQELMQAWKEDKITHKQALRQMAALRADLAKEQQKEQEQAGQQAPAAAVFSPGDSVTHTVFRKKGVVTDVDAKRGKVRLDMGGVSLWADMDVLKPSVVPAPQATSPQPGRVFGRVRERPQESAATAASDASAQSARHAAQAAFSVDLRGLRADEAIDRLQASLDKAYLAEMKEVEVVHGRGTGALRKAVHAWLGTCSQVAGFSLAPADRGGDGMTIVTLR